MSKYQKEEIKRIPFPKHIKLSHFQEAALDCWIKEKNNTQLRAVAGSGKSFTVAAAAHLDPDQSPGLYSSFQTAIVEEVAPKLPEHFAAKGAHALGWGALAKSWDKPNVNVGKFKMKNKIKELSYMNDRNDPMSDERVENGVDLMSKIKITMTDPENRERILELAEIYDIQIDCFDRFLKDIPDLLKWNDEVARQGIVDFDDMIYLPVKYNLPVFQYKRVFLDECQDFSPLMQLFMAKFVHPEGRIMSVGDRNQSIFGFAGADTGAMDNLLRVFGSTELPLSVCYRCHAGAIELAQRIVPEISGHEGTIPGEVKHYECGMDKFEWSNVHESAMILCRRNAPLIRPAFKLIREGRKVTIKGRNLGEGLVKTILHVEKKSNGSMTGFLDKLEEWKQEKIASILARKNINMALIESTEDQAACIESFCEGETDTTAVCLKIKRIFDDKSKDGIIMSTAHRSKGLEHDHVYILDYPNIEMRRESMSAEAKQQERNLHYVAITRAKKFLGLI